MLTCWPKGFLDRDETLILIECLRATRQAEGELTVEEEMALEKLEAALEASPEQD